MNISLRYEILRALCHFNDCLEREISLNPTYTKEEKREQINHNHGVNLRLLEEGLKIL